MKTLLLLALAAPAVVSSAQPNAIARSEVEARYSPQFADCLNDSMATADTLFCIATEAKVQEPKLDEALAAALKRLPAKRKASLRSSQANWELQSRKTCDALVADEQFQRIAEARRGRCLLDETIRRTIELERTR